jgi:hypothetical protein
MVLALDWLTSVHKAAPKPAWEQILSFAWETCAADLHPEHVATQISQRDEQVGRVDLYLSTGGWDLWTEFESVVPHGADAVVEFWNRQAGPAAVLILDGLSLREVPWLLQGAAQRNYMIHVAKPFGSELPPQTTPYANALGFANRAALQDNGAGIGHKLAGATTEAGPMDWGSFGDLIHAEPRWVIWSHWPDTVIHDMGRDLSPQVMSQKASEQLSGSGFWSLVHKLTTGRRLVITSDHGYASMGVFRDEVDKPTVEYLKAQFGAKRAGKADGKSSPFCPPIDLTIVGRGGPSKMVLGRRKWKVSGPTQGANHGGLSLLEVAVPYIELSRPGAN